MILMEYNGKRPVVAADVFIAPTAVLIGDVRVEEGASIWFGAVLRGDIGPISVGPRTSVQDNCVVHPSPAGTLIKEEVTVGHGAVLEGVTIERRAVIGMNAVVLDGATIGEESVIGAGSVVSNNAQIPPRVLAVGQPAQVKKEISGASQAWIEMASQIYVELSRNYLENPKSEIRSPKSS